jgi:hypothetical protein
LRGNFLYGEFIDVEAFRFRLLFTVYNRRLLALVLEGKSAVCNSQCEQTDRDPPETENDLHFVPPERLKCSPAACALTINGAAAFCDAPLSAPYAAIIASSFGASNMLGCTNLYYDTRLCTLLT